MKFTKATPRQASCGLRRGSPYLGSPWASSARLRAPMIEGRARTPSRSNTAARSAIANGAWTRTQSRKAQHGATEPENCSAGALTGGPATPRPTPPTATPTRPGSAAGPAWQAPPRPRPIQDPPPPQHSLALSCPGQVSLGSQCKLPSLTHDLQSYILMAA